MAVKTKQDKGAALATVGEKLEQERDRTSVLKTENNDLYVANAGLVADLEESRAALGEAVRSKAEAVESLKVQLADAHARIGSMQVELTDARDALTDERSQSASANASKAADAETIAGLRGEVKDLQDKLFRIRDAVKAI